MMSSSCEKKNWILQKQRTVIGRFWRTHTHPLIIKKRGLTCVWIFHHFNIFCSAAVAEKRKGNAEEFICLSVTLTLVDMTTKPP